MKVGGVAVAIEGVKIVMIIEKLYDLVSNTVMEAWNNHRLSTKGSKNGNQVYLD